MTNVHLTVPQRRSIISRSFSAGVSAMRDDCAGQSVRQWWTVDEAAAHAKCGRKSIYLAVSQGKLQAARLGGRRQLRFLPTWVDAWLLASSTPVLVNTVPRGDDKCAQYDTVSGTLNRKPA